MTSTAAPICMGCTRLRAGSLACDAFPDGIPEPILDSTADHRKPYRGDGGLRFDPVDDAAKAHAAETVRLVKAARS